jgi:hypothetical protein
VDGRASRRSAEGEDQKRRRERVSGGWLILKFGDVEDLPASSSFGVVGFEDSRIRGCGSMQQFLAVSFVSDVRILARPHY